MNSVKNNKFAMIKQKIIEYGLKKTDNPEVKGSKIKKRLSNIPRNNPFFLIENNEYKTRAIKAKPSGTNRIQ